LLSVVAEGRARLSIRRSGHFDGMNLGHSWAPYVLWHLDCVLVLVIPICSRALFATRNALNYKLQRLADPRNRTPSVRRPRIVRRGCAGTPATSTCRMHSAARSRLTSNFQQSYRIAAENLLPVLRAKRNTPRPFDGKIVGSER
jgi:hypothetical protein